MSRWPPFNLLLATQPYTRSRVSLKQPAYLKCQRKPMQERGARYLDSALGWFTRPIRKVEE